MPGTQSRQSPSQKSFTLQATTLDRDRWDAVRAVLLEPARRRQPGCNARKFPLSGIAKCEVCDAPLRSAQHHGQPAYRCEHGFHVGRKAEHLDRLVVGIVLARLRRPGAVAALVHRGEPAAGGLVSEAQTLRLRLEQVAMDLAEDRLTPEQFFTVTKRLRERLADVEARHLATVRTDRLDGQAGAPDVEERWATLSLARQRAIVDLLLTVRVELSRRGKVFDAESVQVAWKTEGGATMGGS